jgi:CBS domain-containing protein
MQLRHVMNRKVASVAADTPLREAAREMSVLNIPVLPVCDGPTLIGLITPRDLILRATAQGCNPRTSTVREVMTRRVVCAREDQDINDAADLMYRWRLRRLPVVDKQMHLVGMVSLGDLY